MNSFKEFMQWGDVTFEKVTSISSMSKMQDEVNELWREVARPDRNRAHIADEIADVMMCALMTAQRSGISYEELEEAFKKKLEINKGRKWKLNSNNTYSHVKNQE